MGESATKSDSIDGHYVAQCVTFAINSVAQSAYEGAEAAFFTAKNAVNKRHIHRNRAYQLMLGVGLRVLWGFTLKGILYLIFLIYLGIVGLFMPAALDGSSGKLQEIGCRVWSSNLYLHVQTAPSPKPMAQAAWSDFNKKMYRHDPGVSTGLCGLYQFIRHRCGSTEGY